MADSKKKHIIEESAKIIRQKGYTNTGIQEILNTCNIPKGSFYYYFKSKEELGFEIIDHYFKQFESLANQYLKQTDIPPTLRLKSFINASFKYIKSTDAVLGCGVGNIAQELSTTNEHFRKKLETCFNNMQAFLLPCIQEIITDKRLVLDPKKTTEFVFNSWQGAILRSKLLNSISPVMNFNYLIFEKLLA